MIPISLASTSGLPWDSICLHGNELGARTTEVFQQNLRSEPLVVVEADQLCRFAVTMCPGEGSSGAAIPFLT